MDKSSLSDPFDFSGPWPTVRECLAQGLGPYRTRISRRDMTASHARQLIETYPGLYRHADSPCVCTSPSFARQGFACGDGWFDIIDRLSMKLIEDPYLVVVQVKEKMGELRVYLDAVDGAPEPNPTLAERLHADRAAAREESLRTCELCGAPAKLEETSRHWLFVHCKPCNCLADLLQACEHLGKLMEGKDFTTFATDGISVAAATRHAQHLGEAASHQSPERRAKFPSIDWKRLDNFRPIYVEYRLNVLSPEEIWKFVHDDVPVIKDALL